MSSSIDVVDSVDLHGRERPGVDQQTPVDPADGAVAGRTDGDGYLALGGDCTAARTSSSSVTETATSGAGIADRSKPALAASKPGVPGSWTRPASRVSRRRCCWS
jgi:hypothetical protein